MTMVEILTLIFILAVIGVLAVTAAIVRLQQQINDHKQQFVALYDYLRNDMQIRYDEKMKQDKGNGD